MQRYLATAFVAFGCALSLPVHADFSATFATVQGAGDAPLARIAVSGSHLRMDSGDGSVLVDASSGRVLMLQHDKREYMDMTRMAQTLSAMLANVPPQMREMMKQRMAAHGGGGTVAYAATGTTQTIAGDTCTVYRVTIGGNHQSDACLGSLSGAGIDAADQATLRKSFDALREMAQSASAGMFASGLNQLPTDKFPLQITQYDNGKVRDITQLKSVSHAGIPASEFAIPTGFREQQMPGLGANH
jgi:hypothetical protein